MRSQLAIYAGSFVLALVPPIAAAAGCTFGFDNVAQLRPTGWSLINNSGPIGITGWFQGIPSRFVAQAGATNSYVSADFNNTSGAFSVISNWLITPDIQFVANATLSFYTRELSGAGEAANHLEVSVCEDSLNDCSTPGTASGDRGGFQTTLVEVNASAVAGGYPASWMLFSVGAADGMPQSGSGRIAFRYYDFAQGPTGDIIGTTIGIDTLAFTGLTVCPFTDVIFQNGFE